MTDVTKEMVKEHIRMGPSGSSGGVGERRVPSGSLLQHIRGGCEEIHRGGEDPRRWPAGRRRIARIIAQYCRIVPISW